MVYLNFNFNKMYFILITQLIEYRKLTKVTAKSEKWKSSKTDASDFKLESVKMFLMKFQRGSNFRQKFQAVLEYEPKESDKKAPIRPKD